MQGEGRGEGSFPLHAWCERAGVRDHEGRGLGSFAFDVKTNHDAYIIRKKAAKALPGNDPLLNHVT